MLRSKELKEQLKVQNAQIQGFVNQVNKQANQIKELEKVQFKTSKLCSQLERLLQHEQANRNRLESENESLKQTICRLKAQLSAHEKDKSNNDELVRVLNATLMERKTEVSILKLKLTRMQTNPSSTLALNSASSVNSVKKDPCNVYPNSTSTSGSKIELSDATSTPAASPFKRGAIRSTLAGVPGDFRLNMSPMRQAPVNFKTDKPFAEWDTDMLVSWLTMIGLSMYTNQCRRWVKCGAHIMNATPAEVDKGLGITNHLHRKKLRLAISELNGDCDKVTKAAAKLDYLWVARWLDDIGLPQYKEAFINARVDGRVLNYLTVEDLVSLGVKSVLHHASIRCGIRVLRSIEFNLQQLKRRASSEEVETMRTIRRQFDESEDGSMSLKQINPQSSLNGETEVPLWTCHRIMEWLRLIDFAEFASNLRGSGVHGGLIVYEDGFNFDTLCSLLSIPISRTLLRRHLLTFFKELIGKDLFQKKREHQELASNQQLNPSAEIKTPKKTQLWFGKKNSKIGQDEMDEYLCPMYPVESRVMNSHTRKNEHTSSRELGQLSKIPESINV